MTNNRVHRIAYVRYSQFGKPYVAKCDRQDIVPGDRVYVSKRTEAEDGLILDGTVTDITYQRWNCQWRVLGLENEQPGIDFDVIFGL